MDETSKFKYAEKKGIEKGRKEGKEEGLHEGMEKGKLAEREQLIRGMHKNGMDIEDIAKFTNMDLSDVRHILEQ
ncbi:histidine kinase (plasmid) [Bacillus cereus]|nr:histidine kinase [Bacillus cereus]